MKIVILILLAIGCGSDGKPESSSPDEETIPIEEDSPTDFDTGSEADTAAPDMGCPEDVAVFEERVWAPVLSVYCQGCHSATGPASSTRMVFDDSDMLHNLRAASRVADVLLLKPTGLHEDGHGGGALVLPESESWQALSFWVDWTRGVC